MAQYDQSYIHQTRKFHTKAIKQLSAELYDDPTYLVGLMQYTDTMARLSYVDKVQKDNPTPRLRTSDTKSHDTSILLWYLTKHQNPTPSFRHLVSGQCRTCRTEQLVDHDWRVCRSCHEVDIWRQWLLSVALHLFPYPSSKWTEEWTALAQQAAAGLASFVDTATNEFQGGSWDTIDRMVPDAGVSTPDAAYEAPNNDEPTVTHMVRVMCAIHDLASSSDHPSAGVDVSTPNASTATSNPHYLNHYNDYLEHLREMARTAPDIDVCAEYTFKHVQLMTQIPEYASNAVPTTRVVSSAATTTSPTDTLSNSQLTGQLGRAMLREWFVENIGLTEDDSDGFRLPNSARSFWFAEPNVSAQDIMDTLLERVGGSGDVGSVDRSGLVPYSLTSRPDTPQDTSPVIPHTTPLAPTSPTLDAATTCESPFRSPPALPRKRSHESITTDSVRNRWSPITMDTLPVLHPASSTNHPSDTPTLVQFASIVSRMPAAGNQDATGAARKNDRRERKRMRVASHGYFLRSLAGER